MFIFLNCMLKITSVNKDRITIDTSEYVALCSHLNVSLNTCYFDHATAYTLVKGIIGMVASMQKRYRYLFFALATSQLG